MSPSSGESSRSWTGGGRGANLDIIDLDRYMRGHVRGANRRVNNNPSHLIVDAGGGQPRKVTDLTADSSSSTCRDKRYSHDSGLSDGSYKKKRRQPRRRVSAKMASPRSLESGPRSSLRDFREHTERALKEQQEQIARVAQICERLTVRSGGGGGGGRGGSDTADTSDISTTTSGGERLRDVRECKTYKIIMSKLDELNRMFATRAKPTPPQPPTTHSVNTYTGGVQCNTRTLMERAVGSDVTAPPAPSPADQGARHRNSAPPTQSPASPPPLSRLTPALALQMDIAPARSASRERRQNRDRDRVDRDRVDRDRVDRDRVDRDRVDRDRVDRDRVDSRGARHSGTLNVATESVLHYSSSSASADTSAGTSAPHYHLDMDPITLYEQAKRLQALQAQTRRARSVDSSLPTVDRKRQVSASVIYNSRPSARDRSRGGSSSGSGLSVCARCRRYWRALTRCLHALHNYSAI